MRERIGKLKQKIKNQKGFTLIELMATLAILALIVAIAIPAVGNILDNAERQSQSAHIDMIEAAGEMAKLGELASSTDPVSYTAKALVDGGYLNAELETDEESILVVEGNGGTFQVDPSTLPTDYEDYEAGE